MDWLSAIRDMIVSAEGLALLGIVYALWWLTGRIPNLFSPKKWDWKRGAEDLCKLLLMVTVLITLIGVANIGAQFWAGLGFDITEGVAEFSSYALMTAMGGGFVYYGKLAAANAWTWFKLKKENSIKGDKNKFDEGVEIYGDATIKAIGEIFSAEDLNTEEGLAEETLKAEEEEIGGRGRYYPVQITSYDVFRAQVINNGFDLDNAYGNQCWDGAALLWQQLGRTLQTGNGCAYGCWTLKRDVNAGSNFLLVVNKEDVRRGDVVVFQGGQYGHIGFADENYNGGTYIRLLGQNQGGPNGNFNVINMSMAGFLGAFRFKGWTAAADAGKEPQPISPQKSNEQIADEVMAGKWGNDPERTQRLKAAGYNRDAIQAIVNAKSAPKTQPTAAPKANKITVGSTVVPTRLVDYTGHSLRQYDATYVVTQLDGNRAVLSARGSVWAAMRTQDLKLA